MLLWSRHQFSTLKPSNLILFSIYQIVSKNVYEYQIRKIQRSCTKGLWVKLRMFNPSTIHIFERSQRDLVNTTYSSFFRFQFMCFRMRVCSSIKVMFRACFGSSSMLAICINFHFFFLRVSTAAFSLGSQRWQKVDVNQNWENGIKCKTLDMTLVTRGAVVGAHQVDIEVR